MSMRDCLPGLIAAVALGAGCVQAPPVHAEHVGFPLSQKVCKPAQADAAGDMVDRLHDWATFDAYFKAYRQCDDGGIAEGSSEAVARLLADHWDSLRQLERLIHREPSLQPFVLDHINGTLDTDDLEKIVHEAGSSCPSTATSLCAKIRQAARQALK
jgi:hypothetical protein